MSLPIFSQLDHGLLFLVLFGDKNFNLYTLYRWLMLGVTIFNVFNVVVSILKYKRYFDQLPNFLRQYLQRKTQAILGSKLTENYREAYINLGLLGILISLNIVLFWI